MTPAVREWVEKAEEDWRVASREVLVRQDPVYGAVCFHAQPCAEKYFKALLAHFAIPFPKVHDLLTLRSMAVPRCRALSRLNRRRLATLSRAAVEYRYPGGNATRRMAGAAVTAARQIRSLVRSQLGLPEVP